MAKANFVKAAQKDIYVNGKRVEYLSEKGKRAGQMKSKTDRSIPRDENDMVLIKKGEPYYWWQFMNGGKHISKDRPRQSQLTQSNYMQTLYVIQENMEDTDVNDFTEAGELESFRDDIVTSLEELRDETQDSLDNMPEHLQDTSTAGQLLTERIEALESAIDELESLDFDYDPDEVDLAAEDMDEHFKNWAAEKLDEMMCVSFEG